VLVSDIEGGLATRLTYWGDRKTLTLGWTELDEVLVCTAAGQPSGRRTWAHAVPTDGGPSRLLPYGPVSGLADGELGTVLVSAVMSREPAWWKRYRGGTAGKLWWRPRGSAGVDRAEDGDFVRLLPDLDGNIEAPMVIGSRVAFLSDHEGWGNIYSVAVDSANGAIGTDLRRHTEHGSADSPDNVPAFYARHATTEGGRIVYECAGELWLLESLDEPARRLDIRLGGPRTARARHHISPERHLSSAVPDRTGRLSVVGVRGTVHRLVHRDGPARTLLATHPNAQAPDDAPEEVRRCVRHGASPRGGQALLWAAKARALTRGRLHVALEDIESLCVSALRHRLILGYEGEASGIGTDALVRAAFTHARERTPGPWK